MNNGKQSQADAGYGQGKPTRHCGLCRFFDSMKGECSEVEGDISAFGLSSVYNPRPNPFGSKLGPKETAIIERMMASPPDQSDAVGAGPAAVGAAMRIGSKSYEG